MREIEAKYRVRDVESLLSVLKNKGIVFSDPVQQDDQAYAQAGWDYSMPKIGVLFGRLRTQDGQHLFTVKRPVNNEMECVEHESVVADRDAMHGALTEMGFAPTVRIVKTRRIASVEGLVLCLDEVENAGAFLEVEMVVRDDRDGLEAQADLDAFIRGLGVEAERTTQTYDSLVRDATAERSSHLVSRR